METRAQAIPITSVVGALFLGLGLCVSVQAGDITRTIGYQGFLTDSNGLPVDGIKDMEFALYGQATGGSPAFVDQRCQSGSPDGPGINIVQGRYEIEIASETTGGVSAADTGIADALWLEVRVDPDDNCAGFESLGPRIRLQSAAYAFKALHASTATNVISATDIRVDYDSDNNASGVMRVLTGGANVMHFENDGDVGIAITNPTARLEVRGGASGPAINWGNATTLHGRLTYDSGDAVVASLAGMRLRVDDTTEVLFLESSTGDVGIGTTSPDHDVHVYRNDTGVLPSLMLEQDSTGDASLGFRLTGGQGWMIGIDNSRGDLLGFAPSSTGVGNSTIMVMESGGDVGIGTTNPDDALDVIGDIEASGNLKAGFIIQRVNGTSNTECRAGCGASLTAISGGCIGSANYAESYPSTETTDNASTKGTAVADAATVARSWSCDDNSSGTNLSCFAVCARIAN
jgi:hypothetical protein